MEQRVRQYIQEQKMVFPGDTLVAGVSGGADSLCLFLILEKLSREMDFCLHAVHVHHGLRVSAQDDLEYVERLCRQMQVPCTLLRVDAAAKAKEWGTGVEEAGRRLRYEGFAQVGADLARQRGADPASFRIAVAHHREDQAETVLFHLCRGTDLRGARGMLPVNGQIIRPLLCESRSSIEEYLTARGFTWREDETNADTAYTRNFLRREILPRLESGVHAAAAERISQFAAACAEAEEYLAKVTEKAMEGCLTACSGAEELLIPEHSSCLFVLNIDLLRQQDPYLQGRILYRCLVDSTVSGKDIGAVHVDALRRLCGGTGDGKLSMPSRVTVLRSAGKLFFCRETGAGRSEERKETGTCRPAQDNSVGTGWPEERKGTGTCRPVQENSVGIGQSEERKETGNCRSEKKEGGAENVCRSDKSYPLSEEEYQCCVRDFDGSMSAIPRNEYTKWFDYDKIGTFPVFRSRQPGDCMLLFQEAERRRESGILEEFSSGNTAAASTADRKLITKKLARIMLDGKIPAGIRDQIVLPFSGKEALWIPGLRMGDSCRVTPETKRILEIRRNPKKIISDSCF